MHTIFHSANLHLNGGNIYVNNKYTNIFSRKSILIISEAYGVDINIIYGLKKLVKFPP